MSDFILSDHVLALVIAVLIFLTTIFLVVKQWIGFSITLLLLVFSLIAGLIINNQQMFHTYFSPHDSTNSAKEKSSQDVFRKQMMQAVEDLKTEVYTEKENLRQVMNQVQEVVDSIDVQKQKLQQFIEETRERFKADTQLKPSMNNPQKDSALLKDH